MENIIWGTLTLLLSTAGFFFAWRTYKLRNFYASLLFILFTGLVLRVFVASDANLHTWDERYHALVAKNLINHPLKPTLFDSPAVIHDYKNWVVNHIWLEKGPVALWPMAASIHVFGLNIWAVRLPSLIISTLAIFVTFLIGYKLFDKKTGLLAAFFHAVNGLAIDLAGGRVSSDHVETAFVFYTELAVLFSILSILHKRTYLFAAMAGISIGLAILCKWAPALIVFHVWLTGVFLSKQFSLAQVFKAGLLMFACCLITFLPWIIYILQAFPKEASWVLQKFIYAYSDTVEGHAAPAYYYLAQTGVIFGELIFLPVFLCFYLLQKKRDWRLWMLNTWWIIPVIIFSLADTKRHTYMLLFAPALFVIGAYSWFWLNENKAKFKYPALINIILALLIILPARYGIERVKPFRENKEANWSRFAKQLKYKIPEKEKVVIYNFGDHYAEAMFYSGLTIEHYIPEIHETDSLLSKGFTIYMIKNQPNDSLESAFKNVKFLDGYQENQR